MNIVLVNFPFTDLSATKLRPAIVVANPGGNNLILCQITTKRRNINKYEIILPKSHCTGDIRFNGNIYVDMLFTLNKTLIKRKIGSIRDKNTQKQISVKLQKLFSK